MNKKDKLEKELFHMEQIIGNVSPDKIKDSRFK